MERGDYIWVPDEDCLLAPKEALNYFRRETENIARLLSFRESHPCREMIPSPSLTPYGEDGEITLEWYARSGSVAIALESDEGLVWKRYHFNFSARTHSSESVPIDGANLWEELRESVISVFAK